MNTSENMSFEKRWYDKDRKMAKVLEIIKSLNDREQQEFGISLFQLSSMVRKTKSEKSQDNDAGISIGKDKVLGLYKSFNKRRWYDRDLSLMSAMNSLSTLPVEECKNITEGILNTINVP